MDNIQGPDNPRRMVWFEPAITRALNTALKLRRQISAIQELDVHDIEAKAHLLAKSEEAMELVKLGADLLISTSLSDTKRRELLEGTIDRKSTRLNSSHTVISYAVFCLKQKKPSDRRSSST